MAGAPKNNKNAEKWTHKEAKEFMEKAVSISEGKEYDFIGEVAKELGTYHKIFDYLSNKFTDLKRLKDLIISNCETNCFSNAKKGDIVASVAIMNLKSNHRWTDRLDNTSSDGSMSPPRTLADIYAEENADSKPES